MAKKSALGKGMASLLKSNVKNIPPKISSDLIEAIKEEKPKTKKRSVEEKKSIPENEVFTVDISQIKPNPNQPRKIFKETELLELKASIQENGILQPLIVTPLPEGGFELVAGERRFRAATSLGLKKVPTVIRRVTDREKLVLALVENIQRQDLNCVEEALAYYQLMSEFNLTQEEVAQKMGKERSSIANYLRILKLPKSVVKMVKDELLSFGHAKILVALKDENEIVSQAKNTLEKGWSVRELEKVIRQLMNNEKTKTKNKKKSAAENFELDGLRQDLERRTGFHIGIEEKDKNNGFIALKYTSNEERKSIINFLIS